MFVKISVGLCFFYIKGGPSVHSSFFLCQPQFCSWNYYTTIRCTSAQQSNTKSCLTSRLSYQPKVSLLPFFTPTTPSQLLSPPCHQTIHYTTTVWFEEEKKLSSTSAQFQQGDYFCTLPIHPLPLVLHQFTNYLKNPALLLPVEGEKNQMDHVL